MGGAGPKPANRIGSGGEEDFSTWRKFGDSDSRKSSQRWGEGNPSSRIPDAGTRISPRDDSPPVATESCREIQRIEAGVLNLANPRHTRSIAHRPDRRGDITARAQDVLAIRAELGVIASNVQGILAVDVLAIRAELGVIESNVRGIRAVAQLE
jgi:hypothetical protein